MLKVLTLLACMAVANAQPDEITGARFASAASDAMCDEPRSWNLLSDVDSEGVTCDGVVYNPQGLRCCGTTLRRMAESPFSKPSSQDKMIGMATDSQFCYGDRHVSSRELVCGGEIVSAGSWDTYGRQTKAVKCCRGKPYDAMTKTYKDTDGSTMDITAAATMSCCAGVPTDTVANQTTAEPALGRCCGTTAIDTATKTCCDGKSEKDDKVFDMDNAKTCCGGEYVTMDMAKTCCGGKYETETNDGVVGVCCGNEHVGTWGLISDLATKAVAPGAGSADSIWTVNRVCGCKNEWVDISTGIAKDQTELDFTREFLCEGNDAAPCSNALSGASRLNEDINCCNGELFLTSAAVCIGSQDEGLKLDLERGEDVTDTGSAERGTLLRKTFTGPFSILMPVNDGYSNMFFNPLNEIVDVYCGKSSATTAVASALAAVCAVVAL